MFGFQRTQIREDSGIIDCSLNPSFRIHSSSSVDRYLWCIFFCPDLLLHSDSELPLCKIADQPKRLSHTESQKPRDDCLP